LSQEVEYQTAPQLRLKPCGFWRHDATGI